MNRHILKISSTLLSFSQRLINRITYRLPTNYQQLANVQFKKISIPTPKKVNVNSKGERVSKSQNFRRRTNPKMHYIVNILFGLSCIGRMGNNPHTLDDARGLLARQWWGASEQVVLVCKITSRLAFAALLLNSVAPNEKDTSGTQGTIRITN